jgi:S-adenosylmethionine:tRNA ribosyltransferase-isomerase
MQLSALAYDLPPELIAQQPAEPRDAARLLVLERASGRITHRHFRDLPEYLRPADCLVLNDTRVLPARFFARRASGGRVEGLFLHAEAGGWRVLLKPAGRLRVGERLACAADHAVELLARLERGEWLVRATPTRPPTEWLQAVGQTPLPPYIRKGQAAAGDAERYQTVYAASPGAVAAPTAGLHFTPELLARIAAAGVARATVTLHVGRGTFVPIEVDDLARHAMHAEWFELPAATAALLAARRASGGRIVAVGTTAVRVLESVARGDAAAGAGETGASAGAAGASAAVAGWTNIFIYPPYAFRQVDALVTNFHLPGSTLLALVMAFASVELVRAAYAAAIAERYRFYSYGDAMLVV